MREEPKPRPHTGWGRPSLGDDLRLRLLFFGVTVIDERWIHRYSSETIWRLYCNDADGATIWSGRRTYRLAAGTVWLIPPWLEWRTACQGTVGHVNAHFEVPQWPQELVQRLCAWPLDVSARVDGDELHAIARGLAAEGPSGERFWRAYAACATALAACCAAAPADVRDALLPAADVGLSGALSWIEHTLDHPLGHRNIAAMMRVSEATMVRRFRSHLGMSPASYVAARRAARAAELLTSTDQSIDFIAAACGFADRRALTRAFSRRFGVPPARYRREHHD